MHQNYTRSLEVVAYGFVQIASQDILFMFLLRETLRSCGLLVCADSIPGQSFYVCTQMFLFFLECKKQILSILYLLLATEQLLRSLLFSNINMKIFTSVNKLFSRHKANKKSKKV